ncbi:MAG: stearoyl-CoA 9-desaturase [Phycisphaerae bacterium]
MSSLPQPVGLSPLSAPELSAPETATAARHKSGRIHWVPAIAICLVHLGALLAFFPVFFSWRALVTAVVLQAICGVGITLGYHRLLTHRSFKTPKWLEYFLAWVGSLSWQGGPIQWVATHRLHHQHSDEDADPHSPRHGFFWAHTLWCMTYDPNFDEYERYSRYAQDLARDRGHVFLERATPIWQFVLAGLLYLWAGWPGVIWGVFVRLVYVYHITWLVNSATHTWGYRNFETTDHSRNLWWVGLLSYGEGWHNNHHAYPRSARHGLKPWEVDVTWMLIRLLSVLGLARDIRLPEQGASRESR